MGLTALAIKAAKGRDKQYKLADSGGLHLLVLPSGQRYWRMNYRYLGRYKTLAFGVWPDVDLADARAKRDDARKLLDNGHDPSEQARLDKIAASVAAANTFKAVAEEWYAKAEKEGLAPATLNKIRWLLDFAYPSLGNRTIAEILPHELLLVLRKFEAKGRHESAKRLRSTCGQAPDVGEHDQRSSSSSWLCPGRNDRARLPCDGEHIAQRNGQVESRCDRTAVGPCSWQ
jgi:hypothetical protein